jgi:2-C-methyl-D-erythritol 4-phosphate cytidylyltransferase
MEQSTAVILPAAGKSTRFGGKEKKPFANIDGRPVWLRAAELFVTRPEVKQVLIVVAKDDMEMFQRRFSANVMFLNLIVVEGGRERFESVANAIKKVEEGIEFIAIHDAVRPCTPVQLIDSVFKAVQQHGAAIPAVAVGDTLKRVKPDMRVESTLARDGLWQAQTPQIFRKDWLAEAYAKRDSLGAAITDDAQLIEALGHPVVVVPGSPFNIKITTHDDRALAELIVKHRKTDTGPKAAHPFADERFM